MCCRQGRGRHVLTNREWKATHVLTNREWKATRVLTYRASMLTSRARGEYLVEVKVQLLVGQVDAHLVKPIVLEVLKPKDVCPARMSQRSSGGRASWDGSAKQPNTLSAWVAVLPRMPMVRVASTSVLSSGLRMTSSLATSHLQ